MNPASRAFTAVLLAGGKSSRMGQDKCLLDCGGVPLWERQVRLLENLSPRELLISARAEQLYLPSKLVDRWPDCGPLGGIATALEQALEHHVLFLAVDLPLMQREPLEHLLEQCGPQQGAVFHSGQFYEPLAAVYPKQLFASAQQAIAQGNYRLQEWIAAAVAAGSMKSIALPDTWRRQFQNINAAADWQSVQAELAKKSGLNQQA